MQPDAVYERLRAFAESLRYSARLRESAWLTPGAEVSHNGASAPASKQAVDDDRRVIRNEAREVEHCLRFQGDDLWQGFHDHVERLLQLAFDRVDRKCASVTEARAQAAEIRKLAGEIRRAADDPVSAFSHPPRWLSQAYLELHLERQQAENMRPAGESGAPRLRYGSVIPDSLEEAEELRRQVDQIRVAMAIEASERSRADGGNVTENDPTPSRAKQATPEATAPPLSRLLTLFTNGVADEKFHSAAKVLGDEKLTANEKLEELDASLRLPATASAGQLGTLLGVTKQAVMKTNWWIQARKGEKASEVGRRLDKHRERSQQYSADE